MSALRNALIAVVFASCLSSTAHAALIYSFSSSASSVPSADFKFTVSDFLTTTTTIAQIDLFDIVYHIPSETLNTVDMISPGGSLPQIQLNFPGGGSLESINYSSWSGPFDHVGSYFHLSGATLSISGTVDVPEPSTLWLLATALGGVWLRRRRAR